jgi:hypothetical protein
MYIGKSFCYCLVTFSILVELSFSVKMMWVVLQSNLYILDCIVCISGSLIFCSDS